LESLNRFDVVQYGGVLAVVVESSLLPPDASVVVIPLLPDYPEVRHLNPDILFDGKRLILATRLIGGARRSAVWRVGNMANQADRITRAVDVLMGGV
jgi:toxin CcdB